MAKQILNIGSSANDGSGTTLRAGGDLINDNFNEIYTAFGDGSTLSSPAIPHKIGGTNFTNSLLIGHSTTGTLNAAERNTGVGFESLDALTSGDANTALGYRAGSAMTVQGESVYLGVNAGYQTQGGNNTAVGAYAFQGSNNANSYENTAIGSRALASAGGSSAALRNTALGRDAGYGISSGDYNVVLGYDSGDNITTGSGNVTIGTVDVASATGDRQLKIAGYDGTTTTTWISGDSSGNLTTIGDVTLANDKKVIFGDAGENITGDGTAMTIASSQNVTLDAAGDITLNADGSIVSFQDGATEFLRLQHGGSNNAVIKNNNSDADIFIKGSDGGSEITALTLDMSEAGAATFNSNVTVGGDLTVNGTTTTVNSTNTTLDDNLLELNSGATSNANDSGIIIERGSTGDNAIFVWDESADKFVLGTTTATASDTGNLSITTGTLVANIEGNITGNITTATALATGRTIGMTGDVVWTSASFDGSGNVTGTSALQANTVSSTELVSATTLLILDSSGSTLKTIIGAGS